MDFIYKKAMHGIFSIFYEEIVEKNPEMEKWGEKMMIRV